MKKITIIGAGPGGYSAGLRASQLGAKVSIIEKNLPGGTCLNRGCIPSKIMHQTASVLNNFKKADELGINFDKKASPCMEKIIKRKNLIIKNQTMGLLNLFKNNNIEIITGNAEIKKNNCVCVHLPDNTQKKIIHDSLIIAAGSKPITLIEENKSYDKILTSDEIFDIKKIPKSIIIIGGGVIGCEFAFIFQAFGSNVTIIEATNKLLPTDFIDRDCAELLKREMKKKKIEVLLNTKVDSIKQNTNTVFINITPNNNNSDKKCGKKESLSSDMALICIGRYPDTKNLNLENTGININSKGWIIADQYLKTNIDNIFAVGDILGPEKIMLAHKAIQEGRIAASNAMGEKNKMDYNTVPYGIFSMPEAAGVGITTQIAEKQQIETTIYNMPVRAIAKSHISGSISGFAKIITHKKNGTILGIHITGPHATELIAEGVISIKTKLTIKELAESIHNHPTISEILWDTANKIYTD